MLFKGVEFDAVGSRYNGSPLQFVTGWKLIRTDDMFEIGRFRPVWAFSQDFEVDFGLKQSGGVMRVTRGYGRDCWEFARKLLVFRQFWYEFGEVENGTELVEIFEQLGVSHFAKNFVNVFHIFGLIYAKNYGFAEIG